MIIANKKRYSLLFLSALLLTGCQMMTAQQIGQSWVGYAEQDLLMQWGAPSRTADSGDTTIHTWDRAGGQCQQTLVIRNSVVVDHSSNC